MSSIRSAHELQFRFKQNGLCVYALTDISCPQQENLGCTIQWLVRHFLSKVDQIQKTFLNAEVVNLGDKFWNDVWLKYWTNSDAPGLEQEL